MGLSWFFVWRLFVKTLKDWLMVVMGLALAGSLTYVAVDLHGARPVPRTMVDGAALGRNYAVAVTTTLSDAWTAAADAVAQGKTITEAQKILQDKWKADRTAVFTAKVAPTFVSVLPEASEPKDDAQRAAVVTLWRSFARGLKGGR